MYRLSASSGYVSIYERKIRKAFPYALRKHKDEYGIYRYTIAIDLCELDELIKVTGVRSIVYSPSTLEEDGYIELYDGWRE